MKPESSCVRVTLAPRTMAEVESVTIPRMVPCPVCAKTAGERSKQAAKNSERLSSFCAIVDLLNGYCRDYITRWSQGQTRMAFVSRQSRQDGVSVVSM